MARFGRNFALLDLFLITVLIILVYIFMSRMGYISSDPGDFKVDSERSGDAFRSTARPTVAYRMPTKAAAAAAAAGAEDTNDGAMEEVNVAEPPDAETKLRDERIHAKDNVRSKEDAVAQDEIARKEIDERLKRIKDVRASSCKGANYDQQVLASFILDFFDYQLYDLKVTVGSILRFTPASLIKEIIIVDDGSTLDYLIKEAQVYVNGIPKAVLVRNEARSGRMNARKRGAREAVGHNLIFLDTTVIVSEGWLEPLVHNLQVMKNAIIQPHFDKISDPVSYEYIPIKEHLVSSFSWSLAVRMVQGLKNGIEAIDPEFVDAIDSPMIHGAAFGITKEYFEEIGKFDDGLSDNGGENFELSLRTWLCGGKIVVLPCSRVGVLNVYDPVRISSFANIYRIVQVWLPNHKPVIKLYLDHDFEANADADMKKAVEHRQSWVTERKCPRDAKWLLENIARDVFAPSKDAVHFGYLKVQNGLCGSIGKEDRLDLGSCRAMDKKLLPRQMTFEVMKSGELKINGKCLHCMENAYVKAVPCTGGKERKQQWDYKDRKIINRWSKYCLMHVTDPDQGFKNRQIAMAQPCDADKSTKRDFSKFDFIKS